MNTLTFKMGASDHHKIVGTMPRSAFTKGKPKKIFYGCYKNFDNEKFKEELKSHLSSVQDFESSHVALKTAPDRFVRLNKKLCETTVNPSWQKPFVKLL